MTTSSWRYLQVYITLYIAHFSGWLVAAACPPCKKQPLQKRAVYFRTVDLILEHMNLPDHAATSPGEHPRHPPAAPARN